MQVDDISNKENNIIEKKIKGIDNKLYKLLIIKENDEIIIKSNIINDIFDNQYILNINLIQFYNINIIFKEYKSINDIYIKYFNNIKEEDIKINLENNKIKLKYKEEINIILEQNKLNIENIIMKLCNKIKEIDNINNEMNKIKIENNNLKDKIINNDNNINLIKNEINNLKEIINKNEEEKKRLEGEIKNKNNEIIEIINNKYNELNALINNNKNIQNKKFNNKFLNKENEIKNLIKGDIKVINNKINESENIKYKYSLFFMAIFNEKYNLEYLEKTEQDIFDSSKNEFLNSMKRIIQQNETKEPFFEINNVNEIINVIKDRDDNMEEEFNFISKEFEWLGKESYIKNNLLDDLINFSKKSKVERLLQDLIYFIESCKNLLFQFQETEFIAKLKNQYKIINSKGVTGEEIQQSIKLLSGFDYDVDNEDSLIKFYEIFYGKADSIEFIKKIKDSNLEIRNLNEFIDENENSQLQTTDIDNLLDIYTFFKSLIDNTDIKTDKSFHDNFRNKYKSEKNIIIKLKGYLSSYSEIIQLFILYNENPEMTTQKINKILNSSNLEIYKDEKRDSFIFKIKYSNQKENESNQTQKESYFLILSLFYNL